MLVAAPLDELDQPQLLAPQVLDVGLNAPELLGLPREALAIVVAACKCSVVVVGVSRQGHPLVDLGIERRGIPRDLLRGILEPERAT